MKTLPGGTMSSFTLYAQLPRTEKELDEHVKALSGMTAAHSHEAVFDHLYGCLSILDSKSSSLLSFNSIIIAVFAIFMTVELQGVEWVAIVTGMAMVLVSSFLLLSVVWVHWSTTDHLKDHAKHTVVLLDVRKERTVRYRLSWYFAVLAMVNLSAFLLIRAWGVITN
jgi:hypothetical protein